MTKIPRKPKTKEARNAKRPALDLTGLSLVDVAELLQTPSARNLNKRDLNKILRKLRDSANKRLKRLEERGLADSSQAYQNRRVKRGGKRIGKARRFRAKKRQSRVEKVKEIEDLLRFHKMKTASTKGTKEVVKAIEQEVGVFPDKDTAKEFWENYHRLIEEYGFIRDKNDAFYMGLRKKFYEKIYGENADAKTPLEDVMQEMRDYIDEHLAEREANLEDTSRQDYIDMDDEGSDIEKGEIKIKGQVIDIFGDDEE